MRLNAHYSNGWLMTGLCLIVLMFTASVVCADPPPTINIRGQLLDEQGHALSGMREFRVQFYDAESAGTPLDAPSIGATAVSPEGLFNIQITLPPAALAAPAVWYEVSIASGATPGPLTASDTFPNRVKVQSVPFALESATANHVELSAIGTGTVSEAEFNYLAGVTGGLQGQLDSKATSADVYTKAQVDASQSAQNTNIAAKADATNVYTKAELDASQSTQDTTIAAKANSADVYTKAQVDASQTTQNTTISAKANSADVYTKAQVDTSLAAKANSADVYTKAQVDTSQTAQNTTIATKANSADVYTKAQVDTSLTAKANASDLTTETTNRTNADTTEATARTNADALKVAKAGDTMTGALNVNGSYIGVGQATAPSPVTDKLYNVGGTLQWNGNPAYRFPWTIVTANTVMSGNNGYIANGTSLISLVLPASSSLNVGDTLRVSGMGTGGWIIAPYDGLQSIQIAPLQLPDYSGFWTARDSSRAWQAMAASGDGTKLVAVEYGGMIYTSTDSGATWTARDANRNWTGVASSADGTKLAVIVRNGQIYTSTDSGVTWTARATSQYWNSIASSADGTKLVACVLNGPLYTSTDSGATWTSRESSRQWQAVASAADGTKLLACVWGGQIYTSADSGVTWTARESNRNWSIVVASADGARLAASVFNGQIYTSADAGITWTARGPNRSWLSLDSSGDGSKMIAGVTNTHILTSNDYGITWTTRIAGQFNWYGVTMSMDGSKLAACANLNQIYTLDTQGFVSQTSNNITGTADSTIELQYEGSSVFRVLNHETGPAYQALSKPEVEALVTNQVASESSARQTADLAKVTRAGDTMTGALTVNNSYVGIGQATAPGTPADKLYNVGGMLQWNGSPTYRFPWTVVTASAQTVANNGYIANAASILTLTLPLSASINVGDTVRVNGIGAGGWKITQNASQAILTDSLHIPDYSGTWKPRDSTRNWSTVVSSADGTKLLAGVQGGQLYTSTDAGMTWIARESNRQWSCSATSSDGTKLVAVVYGGQIYTSTNSGVAWTARDSARDWSAVASSADGTKLVASVFAGQIYTSADLGVTWTPRDSARNWWCVASSADGAKLVAGTWTGFIYTSTDSGVTWTPRATDQSWLGVASSADGSKLVACATLGAIYTSQDSGVTWRACTGNFGWKDVASSADGTRLVACASNALYTSTNSGITWKDVGLSAPYTGVTASADGMALAACIGGGGICTYNCTGRIIAPSTTVGTTGYVSGGRNCAIELQYIGGDTFVPISHEGSLGAN